MIDFDIKNKINAKYLELFNFPIVEIGEYNDTKYFDLFPKKTILSSLFEDILSATGYDYDLIVIVRVNAIGESYILNYLYDEIKRKNKADKICFVLHNENKKYESMFKMFSDVDVFNVPISIKHLNALLKKNFYIYKNKKFIVYHTTVDNATKYLKYKRHYVETLKKYMNVKKLTKKEIKISEDNI